MDESQPLESQDIPHDALMDLCCIELVREFKKDEQRRVTSGVGMMILFFSRQCSRSLIRSRGAFYSSGAARSCVCRTLRYTSLMNNQWTVQPYAVMAHRFEGSM